MTASSADEPTTPHTRSWSAPGEGHLGALVLHGLTGNPGGVLPIARHLAEAGAAVEVPLLPGHGTAWRDLTRVGWRDWARTARTSLAVLRARSERQVVVGLSMGGALTLLLAETEPDLAGIALINPALTFDDPRRRILPLARRLGVSVGAIGDDIAQHGRYEGAYPRVPAAAIAELAALQDRVRAHLDQIRCPVLLLTSVHDHVVPPRDSDLVAHGVASDHVEQVALQRSYHVATLDHDGALVAEQIARFAARVAGPDAHATPPVGNQP